MKSSLSGKVKELVSTYESIVRVMDKNAKEDEERAYGGVIRSVKGKLQEYLTQEIVKMAWDNVGGKPERLAIDSKKYKVPIRGDYVARLKNEEIKRYILSNIKDYYFPLSVDKQIYIDKKLVIGIECKAYTENAMLKRILVDFTLLKTLFPNMSCYLFQLESQLGGDYSYLRDLTFGSPSSHTLLSYFPTVNLSIFTFLKGERKVDKPIHKNGYFKPLEKKQIERAVEILSEDLKKYL
jgi:hypothetical protein